MNIEWLVVGEKKKTMMKTILLYWVIAVQCLTTKNEAEEVIARVFKFYCVFFDLLVFTNAKKNLKLWLESSFKLFRDVTLIIGYFSLKLHPFLGFSTWKILKKRNLKW